MLVGKQVEPVTPWRYGRLDGSRRPAKLLFRRMFEDPTVELRAFRGRRRIVCIASGGCVAISLVNAGHEVTGVDVNPAQIEHVRARLASRIVDDSLAALSPRGRRLLWRTVGIAPHAMLDFLNSSSPEDQIRMWDRLCTRRARIALRVCLHPMSLRVVYAKPFVKALPARFDALLLQRLRGGISRHSNRDNPFIWQLLAGARPHRLDTVLSPNSGPIRLLCSDVVSFLRGIAPGSFDAFSLSNILDGCDSAYADALVQAVRHAAAPGAVIVLRSFAESPCPRLDWRTQDRSHLWGSVSVQRVEPQVQSAAGQSHVGFGRVLPPPVEGDRHASAA